jgi:hypothetical protein
MPVVLAVPEGGDPRPEDLLGQGLRHILESRVLSPLRLQSTRHDAATAIPNAHVRLAARSAAHLDRVKVRYDPRQASWSPRGPQK